MRNSYRQIGMGWMLCLMMGQINCIYAAFPTPNYGVRYRRIFDAQGERSSTSGNTMLGREAAPAVERYYQGLGGSGDVVAQDAAGAAPAPAGRLGGGPGASGIQTMMSLPGR